MAAIQGTGGLASEAFRAALRAQQEATNAIGQVGGAGSVAPGSDASGVQNPDSFIEKLGDGLRDVNAQASRTEAMPQELVTGKIDEFHEVAIQLKQSDLSFRFALQVRNKLIDAYREVMRMSV